jgi:hypothetical protein
LAVARVADRQWGVVGVAQLRAAGVAAGALKHQAATGRLRPLHRGVYAVGHRRLRPEGHWLAAVLACGDGAVLSHASAAALWGIRASTATRIDVTAPGMRRGRSGIRVHSSRRLDPQDVTSESGVPVTSIARTLLDLAATLSPGDLESTVASALRRPGFDAGHVADVVARGQGHRGAGRLATLVAAEPKLTRSALERRSLALARDGGLPEPETNVPMTLGGGQRWEIDVLWRRERVTVELDGWQHHHDRRSFEADRARAATLTAAGYRHLQLTWRQITQEPARALATLRAALGG